MAQLSNENNKLRPQRPPINPKAPARKLPPKPASAKKPPAKPAAAAPNMPKKPEAQKTTPLKKPEAPKVDVPKIAVPKRPDVRPPKPTGKTTTVENKNLKVVEKALSIEELNARKQRRIRNGTYAMSVITILLIVILILIIFWPAPKHVEAVYDFSLNKVPSVTKVEHVIRSDEIDGNIVTFKEPISIKIDKLNNEYCAVAIKPKFKVNGVDKTDEFYLQLVYNNSEDIYNVDNVKVATVGSLENIAAYQIYVDLAENDYVYFTNILTADDEKYQLAIGFLAKDQSLLSQEITFDVDIYGVNAETLQLINSAGGAYVRIGEQTQLPASQEWVNEVKNNLSEKKN